MASRKQSVNSTKISVKCGQCKKAVKDMTVLRLGAKVVKIGFKVPVLTSPRKKLKGLEQNETVCDFVTHVSSRMTTSSILQKPKVS